MSGNIGSGGGSTEFTPTYKKASQSTVNRAGALSQQPYQPYTGGRVAPFNPMEQQAFTGIANRATSGDPTINAGANQLQQTLSGAYLNGNPYLDQMIGRAQGDIADQYKYMTAPSNMAQASMSGSLDNTGMAGADMMDRFSATRAMGDVDSQMRFANYANERGLQAGAADPSQTMPYGNQAYSDMLQLQGAGGMQRGLAQQGLDTQYQQFQEQQQYPYNQLSYLSDIINTMSGGGKYGGQSTSNQMPLYSIPLTLAGSYLSSQGG